MSDEEEIDLSALDDEDLTVNLLFPEVGFYLRQRARQALCLVEGRDDDRQVGSPDPLVHRC